MADQLSLLGVSDYLGHKCARFIVQITHNPTISALLLTLCYVITMLFFSSITGHAVALVGPFMAAGKKMGCSPTLITALLAYFSSLSACLV